MNDKTERIRQAFRVPLHVPAKVTPQGFEVKGHLFPELLGCVGKLSLARKLFEEGILTCLSPDGEHGTGGKACSVCCHHDCQPRLRLQLVSNHVIHLIELSSSSAKNLFAVEDAAARAGVRLWDWVLRLTIESHGHWGEVHFQKAPSSVGREGSVDS